MRKKQDKEREDQEKNVVNELIKCHNERKAADEFCQEPLRIKKHDYHHPMDWVLMG